MNLVSKLRITEANTGSENERERDLKSKAFFEKLSRRTLCYSMPSSKTGSKTWRKKRPMPLMAINATTSSSFHQTAKQGVTNALWKEKAATARIQHPRPPAYPTTPLKLNASKKPLKSSFLTSTTSCSKESIRTLAPVSSTTSWNAEPNLLLP